MQTFDHQKSEFLLDSLRCLQTMQFRWTERQESSFNNENTSMAALSGHAPSWLTSDNCCLVIDNHPKRLHLADSRTLLVSWTWTKFGNRAFSAGGPRVWNDLAPDLWQPESLYSRWRCFYLVSGTKAHYESPFNCAFEILFLTYLLKTCGLLSDSRQTLWTNVLFVGVGPWVATASQFNRSPSSVSCRWSTAAVRLPRAVPHFRSCECSAATDHSARRTVPANHHRRLRGTERPGRHLPSTAVARGGVHSDADRCCIPHGSLPASAVPSSKLHREDIRRVCSAAGHFLVGTTPCPLSAPGRGKWRAFAAAAVLGAGRVIGVGRKRVWWGSGSQDGERRSGGGIFLPAEEGFNHARHAVWQVGFLSKVFGGELRVHQHRWRWRHVFCLLVDGSAAVPGARRCVVERLVWWGDAAALCECRLWKWKLAALRRTLSTL